MATNGDDAPGNQQNQQVYEGGAPLSVQTTPQGMYGTVGGPVLPPPTQIGQSIAGSSASGAPNGLGVSESAILTPSEMGEEVQELDMSGALQDDNGGPSTATGANVVNPIPSVAGGSPGTSSTYRLGGSNGYPPAYWNPPIAVGSYLPVPVASHPPAAVGSLGTSHDINTPISAVPLADASMQSDEGSSNANTPLPQGSGTLNDGTETDSTYNTSPEETDGAPQEANGT